MQILIKPQVQNGDRTKWYWTEWYGQNVTDKMVAISIDFNSIQLNVYLVTTRYK